MIDVSEFQGTIDWPHVPAGMRVLVRCSYGTVGEDARATENIVRSLSQGHLRVGPYHFLQDQDATAQIAHFLRVAGPSDRYQLRGMIDVEPSAQSHPQKSLVEAAVHAYLKAVDYYPTLYGTHDVLAGLHLSAEMARCPLMLAGYGPNDGVEHDPGPPPAPWSRISAHQYTSVGSCPGVNGHVDVSSVAKGGTVDVPKPRFVIDKYKLSYVQKGGHRVHRWTRTPLLYQRARPLMKRRGAVHQYPHRKEVS